MQDIVLTGCWGSQKKKIVLAFPNGAGQVIHIMVDNWYHGQIVKVKGRWEVFLGPRSDLCSNDIQILKEAIEKGW